MSDVVVVIGVGGMGEQIARRQGPGKKLILADFNEEALARTVKTLRGAGYDVDEHVVDVSEKESVAQLARDAAAAGPVTQVVHTAGVSGAQAPAEQILRVDLLGVAHTLDEFGAVIAPGGSGIIIASMAGSLALGRFPAELEEAFVHTPTEQLASLPVWQDPSFADGGAMYSATKRANQLRVQAASAPWGARGARINSISPGIIATPMGQEELDSPNGAQMRGMINASATGRLGTPGDIAAAVAFLTSDEASFVTGTDLLVDGGVVAAARSGALG